MCLDLKIFDDYERRSRLEEMYRNSDEFVDNEVIKVNFTVVSKRTGYTYDVYAVKDNKFLIFFNKEFRWENMSQFRPNKKTEQERMREEEHTPLFRSQKKEGIMYP